MLLFFLGRRHSNATIQGIREDTRTLTNSQTRIPQPGPARARMRLLSVVQFRRTLPNQREAWPPEPQSRQEYVCKGLNEQGNGPGRGVGSKPHPAVSSSPETLWEGYLSPKQMAVGSNPTGLAAELV